MNDTVFSINDAFKILISQRGWYKDSKILASNASADKKIFLKENGLNVDKMTHYLVDIPDHVRSQFPAIPVHFI